MQWYALGPSCASGLARKRRVLLGLGAGKWENILWFLRHYPLDFTEVHVFEEKKGHFKKPPNSGVPKQYEVRTPGRFM